MAMEIIKLGTNPLVNECGKPTISKAKIRYSKHPEPNFTNLSTLSIDFVLKTIKAGIKKLKRIPPTMLLKFARESRVMNPIIEMNIRFRRIRKAPLMTSTAMVFFVIGNMIKSFIS